MMLFRLLNFHCSFRPRRRREQVVFENGSPTFMPNSKKISKIQPGYLSVFPLRIIGYNESNHLSSSVKNDDSFMHQSCSSQQQNENLEYTCVICLDEFDIGDQVRTLPCDHEYHYECIDPWLTIKSALCPLCKYDCSKNIPKEDVDEVELESPPLQTSNSFLSSLRSLRLQQNGSPSSITSSTFGPTIRADRVEEFSRSWMARSLPRNMRRQIHEAAQAIASQENSIELPARMTQQQIPLTNPHTVKQKWQTSLRKRLSNFSL